MNKRHVEAIVFCAVVAAAFTVRADDSASEHPAPVGPRVVDRVDFNREVRPLFNEHCVACHGGVKQAADLSFVYEEQALTVVEPGDAEESELMLRVLSDDEGDMMPPEGHGRSLNAAEIDVLRRWINEGAHWGSHWSFVAPENAAPLSRPDDHWSRGRVDRFILGGIKRAGLEPSRDAEPDRWQRRVSLDLIGLPPSLDERSDFLKRVKEQGEGAYASEVDRLLDSPAFGERWASVWLDVVRYADSKGLGQDGRRQIWKYRDWVIDAFNDDLPFDEFTIKQLAGDLLPSPTLDDLVATASNRLTQTNEEGGTDDEQFRIEAVMDRVNTTWQAWQGVSFGCVQCHSHPYDPIRHEEYYEFMAFFNNTIDSDISNDDPRLAVPLARADYDSALALDVEIEQLTMENWRGGNELLQDDLLWTPVTQLLVSSSNETRYLTTTVDGFDEFQTVGNVAKETTVTIEAPMADDQKVITAIQFTGLPVDVETASRDSEWGFVVSQFKAWLIVPGTDEPQPLPFVHVIADDPHPMLDPQQSLNGKSKSGFGSYSRIHQPHRGAFVLARPIEVPPGSRIRIAIAQLITETGAYPLVAHRGRLFVSHSASLTDWWNQAGHAESRQRVAAIKKQRRAIKSVATPIMRERHSAMARRSYVFNRGNQLSKTELAKPSTPDFLPSLPGAASPDRLAMARWVASSENPLTARVAVNRFWAQLFGTGIVETQEDFGSSGDVPSHPLLLDDLAARFSTEMSWSVKTLLRELTLSSTYRQTSQVDSKRLAADPRNRLLSRGPRKRLPAETVRDQALAISGLIDKRMHGPPVFPPLPAGVWQPFQGSDKWKTPARGKSGRYRRSVYTYMKRTIPFPMFASFDVPSREFCASRRLPSNTPLQALMMLNDTTLVEASAALAERMIGSGESIDEQIEAGFLMATSREPTQVELRELRKLYDRQLAMVVESELDEPESPKKAIGAGGSESISEDLPANKQSSSLPVSSNVDAMTAVGSVLLNLDEVLTKQ